MPRHFHYNKICHHFRMYSRMALWLLCYNNGNFLTWQGTLSGLTGKGFGHEKLTVRNDNGVQKWKQ